jgi:hypothetical protein
MPGHRPGNGRWQSEGHTSGVRLLRDIGACEWHVRGACGWGAAGAHRGGCGGFGEEGGGGRHRRLYKRPTALLNTRAHTHMVSSLTRRLSGGSQGSCWGVPRAQTKEAGRRDVARPRAARNHNAHATGRAARARLAVPRHARLPERGAFTGYPPRCTIQARKGFSCRQQRLHGARRWWQQGARAASQLHDLYEARPARPRPPQPGP